MDGRHVAVARLFAASLLVPLPFLALGPIDLGFDYSDILTYLGLIFVCGLYEFSVILIACLTINLSRTAFIAMFGPIVLFWAVGSLWTGLVVLVFVLGGPPYTTMFVIVALWMLLTINVWQVVGVTWTRAMR